MKSYRKISAILSLICAALLLCSCSPVMTKDPLTKEPKAIDVEKFEGVWLSGEAVMHVKFASNGIAQVAGLEWKSGHFQIVRGEMVVTEGDEHNFICVRAQEDGKWMDGYLFLQYTFSDQGDLVLWLPNSDVFEEAIEKKRLNGVISKSPHSPDITITSDPEKLLEFINDPDNLKLFEYKDPMILRKVTESRKAEQPDQLDNK